MDVSGRCIHVFTDVSGCMRMNMESLQYYEGGGDGRWYTVSFQDPARNPLRCTRPESRLGRSRISVKLGDVDVGN